MTTKLPQPSRSLPSAMLIAVGLLLSTALTGCARAPAEQRLLEAMEALQSAIEAREVSSAVDYLAEDFTATGGLDREGARNLMRVMVLRHQRLGLSLGPIEVAMFEQRATLHFTAVATGGQGSLLPESARVWQVETAWREEAGEWRMISAQWQ